MAECEGNRGRTKISTKRLVAVQAKEAQEAATPP